MIGKEVGFGVDNFGRPVVLSNKDSVIQIILNILMSRKGNIPGMPHLGIDIYQYLYSTPEEISGVQLKELIYAQCKDLLYLVASSDIRIFVTKSMGKDILIVYIPLIIPSDESDETGLMYSFSSDAAGTLSHNFQLGNI